MLHLTWETQKFEQNKKLCVSWTWFQMPNNIFKYVWKQSNRQTLMSKSKKFALFYYFNWFSIPSGVGSSKEKKFIHKKLKNRDFFHLKCWRHRKILISRFSILAIYVTISKKITKIYNFFSFSRFSILNRQLQACSMKFCL